MYTQTKIRIEKDDYEFIKTVFKQLQYKSLNDYMHAAIKAKIRADRKKIRQMKRDAAMEEIGKGSYENLFESIEGEDFKKAHL